MNSAMSNCAATLLIFKTALIFANPVTSKTAGNFGQINGSGDARFLQLALKLFF